MIRRLVFLAIAVLAEVLSWPWLALGFIVGVCVAAVIVGYERGRWGYQLAPRAQPFEEDED